MRRHHPSVQDRVDQLLETAEAHGALATASEREVAAMARGASCGEMVRPAPGLFARTTYRQDLFPEQQALHMIAGLAKQHPVWIFRSFSAALIWGIDVPHPLLKHVYVIASKSNQPDDLVQASHPSRAVEVETVQGLRVTPFWQTVIECLCRAPFSYGLAIADSALRCRSASRASLSMLMSPDARTRGIRQARFIASYADARAENGGESRVRAFLIAHGYPLPELQVRLPDIVETDRPYYADFLWKRADGGYLIGEFDGKDKYVNEGMIQGRTTVDALALERQRESRLTLLGIPVLRLTHQDLAHPRRITRLLNAAGIKDSPEAAKAWYRAWKSCSNAKTI